jgi:hypothetical protein
MIAAIIWTNDENIQKNDHVQKIAGRCASSLNNDHVQKNPVEPVKPTVPEDSGSMR